MFDPLHNNEKMDCPDYSTCAIKIDLVRHATASRIGKSLIDRIRYSLKVEYGVRVPPEQLQYVLSR